MSPVTIDTFHHVADSLGQPIQTIALAPTGHWWSSPLLQTLVGGLLAVGAGIATEVFREWHRGYRLRRRLGQEVELVRTLLTTLKSELQTASEHVHRVHDQVRTASGGYARIEEEVETELAPQLVHDVRLWYQAVNWCLQGVIGSLASLDIVRRRQDVHAEEAQKHAEGLSARVREIDLLVDQAVGILRTLRSLR